MSSNLRGFWKDEINTKKATAYIARTEKKEIARLKRKAKRKARKEILKTDGDFYMSKEWRSLRYKALRKYSAKCMCCGRSKKLHGVVIHVDHIKPRSKYPELALVFDNLQVLCEDCNIGKSNKDETDWRPPDEESELEILAEARKRI